VKLHSSSEEALQAFSRSNHFPSCYLYFDLYKEELGSSPISTVFQSEEDG